MDHNGEIEFHEFVTATANRDELLQDHKLEQAFKFYDLDNNGSVSLDEIKTAFGTNTNVDGAVWSKIIKEVDADGNGEIDFQEFKTMMKKLLSKIEPSKLGKS